MKNTMPYFQKIGKIWTECRNVLPKLIKEYVVSLFVGTTYEGAQKAETTERAF
jgi:hypothetical protein